MLKNTLQLSWTWHLEAPPERVWPLLADTGRLNREAGLPPLEPMSAPPGVEVPKGSRLLGMRVLGTRQMWLEEDCEWVAPRRLFNDRRFISGPLLRIRTWTRLEALPGGASRVHFEVHLEARYAWLRPLIGLGARLFIPRYFAPVLRHIRNPAREATLNSPSAKALAPIQPHKPRIVFEQGGLTRLATRMREMIEAGADPDLAGKLHRLILESDESALVRLRPYALADAWGAPRRAVLELFLLAARAGLLDFQWDVLCPYCRGSNAPIESLGKVHSAAHCDFCSVDFQADFGRSVEITFRPNTAIRPANANKYSVGGPQFTPHMVARVVLDDDSETSLELALDPGRYFLHSYSLPGGLLINAATGGEETPSVAPAAGGWPLADAVWSTGARLVLRNRVGRRTAFVLERTAWIDDAATGAEVTALQAFRDLFSEEALRPGEEIGVGRLAFLFTDLRGSTRLYREVGDARAFGLVMKHFDILTDAVAAEGGAVVKTIGDAVLAVFPSPLPALRSALVAQKRLRESGQPLILKAGVHSGACIAVNQNGRLDYFGSTLNLAARLLGFSEGGDVVVTREAAADPAVAHWLSEQGPSLSGEDLEVEVRGFGAERFALRRLKPEVEREKSLR